jgi:hypothetical protein
LLCQVLPRVFRGEVKISRAAAIQAGLRMIFLDQFCKVLADETVPPGKEYSWCFHLKIAGAVRDQKKMNS